MADAFRDKGGRFTQVKVQHIISNIKKVKEHQLKALKKGLMKSGRFLLRESKKIVPVRTGALKNSGFVRLLGANTQRPTSQVGYGIYYAIYVHEMTWANFKPGKMAKFLEIPARKHAKKILDIVRLEMMNVTRDKAGRFTSK